MYSGPRYKDIEAELEVARKRKSRKEILAAQYHENQRLPHSVSLVPDAETKCNVVNSQKFCNEQTDRRFTTIFTFYFCDFYISCY